MRKELHMGFEIILKVILFLLFTVMCLTSFDNDIHIRFSFVPAFIGAMLCFIPSRGFQRSFKMNQYLLFVLVILAYFIVAMVEMHIAGDVPRP